MTTSIDKEMKERVKQNAEAIAAYAAGQMIEVKYKGEEWRTFTSVVSDVLFQHDIQMLMEHIREGTMFRPIGEPVATNSKPEIDEETQRAIEHLRNGNAIETAFEGRDWMALVPPPAEFMEASIRQLHLKAAAGKLRCRITPEPITRDWNRPEDVPWPVCWLTHDGVATALFVIGRIDAEGVYVVGRESMIKWDELAKFWKHSTDRKTWAPCTVTEEAK